jgi:hypothetical protein
MGQTLRSASGQGNSGFSHVGKCIKKSPYRIVKAAYNLQTSSSTRIYHLKLVNNSN